jgi:hypothetical protein
MFRILIPIILVMTGLVGSGEVIRACVTVDSGAIRIVSADSTCEEEERVLEWGVMGLQGPPGPPGAAGEPGPAGVGDLGCASGQGLLWNEEQSQWACADAPDNSALQAQVTALQEEVDALKTLLAGVSREGNILLITGANLQIVSGSGSTNGEPNGLGNVIIGYNEERTDGNNVRTGSHMLVVGSENNYSRFGGIVAGILNESSGDFASVSGGFSNQASGVAASVGGGTQNVASGSYASVSGGIKNEAAGESTSVSGGEDSTASGIASSISGGFQNATGGNWSTVSGGSTRPALGNFDWVGGSLTEEN